MGLRKMTSKDFMLIAVGFFIGVFVSTVNTANTHALDAELRIAHAELVARCVGATGHEKERCRRWGL